MESKSLLEQIIKEFRDKQIAQVSSYKSFGYVGETEKAVIVSREKGLDTRVPFDKLLTGIEAFMSDPDLYDQGPTELRSFGITHVTSPVWSLLHLLPKESYK